MEIIKITSKTNHRVKHFLRLQKSRHLRNETRLFVIEGEKEVGFALEAGFIFKQVFIYRDNFHNSDMETTLKRQFPVPFIYEVSKDVNEKMSYRGNVNGILAIVEMRRSTLNLIRIPEKPLILVLDSLEKPGNIGAILRTADAAAVDAVIVCGDACDIYNPNVIRSSVGCVFFNQIVQTEKELAVSWLKSKGIVILGTAINSSEFYDEVDYDRPIAIVLGSEAGGLSAEWLHVAEKLVRIPMLGRNDSLNVSTATAITVYEALRQRKLSKAL